MTITVMPKAIIITPRVTATATIKIPTPSQWKKQDKPNEKK